MIGELTVELVVADLVVQKFWASAALVPIQGETIDVAIVDRDIVEWDYADVL